MSNRGGDFCEFFDIGESPQIAFRVGEILSGKTLRILSVGLREFHRGGRLCEFYRRVSATVTPRVGDFLLRILSKKLHEFHRWDSVNYIGEGEFVNSIGRSLNFSYRVGDVVNFVGKPLRTRIRLMEISENIPGSEGIRVSNSRVFGTKCVDACHQYDRSSAAHE